MLSPICTHFIQSAPHGLTIRGYMKIHMHSSSSVRNRKRYRGVACRTHSPPPERYRAIVHDSVSGCQHFRTPLSESVSGSGLESDIPTLRSPGTIIGVNSDSDHVVSSKRFLPECLINRERGEGTAVRDKDKVCPYRKTRSIPGISHLSLAFFRWNNRVPVITLF